VHTVCMSEGALTASLDCHGHLLCFAAEGSEQLIMTLFDSGCGGGMPGQEAPVLPVLRQMQTYGAYCAMLLAPLMLLCILVTDWSLAPTESVCPSPSPRPRRGESPSPPGPYPPLPPAQTPCLKRPQEHSSNTASIININLMCSVSSNDGHIRLPACLNGTRTWLFMSTTLSAIITRQQEQYCSAVLPHQLQSVAEMLAVRSCCGLTLPTIEEVEVEVCCNLCQRPYLGVVQSNKAVPSQLPQVTSNISPWKKPAPCCQSAPAAVWPAS